MGCAASKDRVESAETLAADSFTTASDLERLQLQAALDKGSFMFTTERSASAEILPAQVPDERPTLGADSAGVDAEPIGIAVCTSDYDTGEDLDLQLKQGDKIMIIERVDEAWFRGYIEGHPTEIGFFPANFVREKSTDEDTPAPADEVEEEEDEVAHEKRTLWVGGIPENQATQEALTGVFGAFGALDNITVRKKETEEHGPNKSWCFVSYKAAESTNNALREAISIKDETGAEVKLRVREPNLVAELSKPSTGALGGIWENHKSLLGAAMKVDLQQQGDGLTGGMTMNKVEKALHLVPTGHKADKVDSKDWEDLAKEGSFETKKVKKVQSSSFRKLKQISRDFEATRSQDMEDAEKKQAAIDG